MMTALQAQIEKVLQGMQKNMFQPWDKFPNPSVVPLPEINSFLKPHVDIFENTEEYVLTVDLPGVDEKDLSLELIGRKLQITGERKASDLEHTPITTERLQGTLLRTIELFDDVNPNSIEATYKNGVLSITLQKLPQDPAQAKKIPIQFS